MLFRKKKDLRAFDTKKIIYDNVEFILCQKCNLSCKHCLRGDSRNVVMKKEIMNAFLKNTAEIGSICLGGGEVSLVPEAVQDFIDSLKENGTKIQTVNITTNGIKYSEEFADKLKQLKEYVLESRKDIVCFDLEDREPIVLRVSLDEFHLESMIESGIKIDDVLDNIKKYQEVLGEDAVLSNFCSDYDLLKEGRARELKTEVPKVNPNLSTITPYMETENAIVVGFITTLGATGEVIPVNISFEREKVLSAGNITKDPLSTIMQRQRVVKVNNYEEFDKKSIKCYKKVSVVEKHIKRYAKTSRMETRQVIEYILHKRGQKLKEDYEAFTFEYNEEKEV